MEAKELFYKTIIKKMANYLDNKELKVLKGVLLNEMEYYSIQQMKTKELPAVYSERNTKLIKEFAMCNYVEGKSKRTIESYVQTVNMLCNIFDVDLLKVNTNTIRTFLLKMEQKGNSSVSLENKRKKLKVFFNWLVDEEYILKNPVSKIKPIKMEKIIKKPYTDIEIVKMKDACKTPRQKALLDLLLSTGCRNEEVCKIKIEDVDFYNKTILIKGKGSKQREVYINDSCAVHLEEYLRDREERGLFSSYLFCNERRSNVGNKYILGGIKTGNLRKIIKDIAEMANINNAYVHKFRRTFCCNMLLYSDLSTVQDLMGHSDPKTTKGYSVFDNRRAKFEHSKLR